MKKILILVALAFLSACDPKPVTVEPPVPPPAVEPTQPPVQPAPVPTSIPTPPQASDAYVGKVIKMGIDAQTIDQALALVKPVGEGTILFERGKVYSLTATVNYKLWIKKSLMLAAYGSGDRPVIKTGGKILISKDNKETVGRLTIKDLVIDNEGNPGLLIRWLDGGEGLLQNTDFLSGGLVVQHYAGEHPKNWILKNIKVIGAYSGNDTSHMQGLYAESVEGLQILNSVFDHNGWSEKPVSGGSPTMFNHNLYLHDVTDTVIKNNQILNASSMGIKMRSDIVGGVKNLMIEDNYFQHGEILVGCGGNVIGPDRFMNVTIQNNVSEGLGKTKPTGRNLAWGIDIAGVTNGVVKNNTLKNVLTTTNKFVVKIDATSKNIYTENNKEI